MNKIQPAIWKSEMNSWAWAELAELATISDFDPIELLLRFGKLSKDAYEGSLPIMIGNTLLQYELESRYATTGSFVFVPYGWAKDVIKAVSEGYSRVTLQIVDDNLKDQPNWLTRRHVEDGFDLVAVGIKD